MAFGNALRVVYRHQISKKSSCVRCVVLMNDWHPCSCLINII